MRIIIIICTAILLFGCHRNIVITGTYSAQSNPDYLKLNTDSTFSYRYSAFHTSEYSSGKWREVNKKAIILSSTVQNETLPLTVSSVLERTDGVYELNLQFDTELELKNYKCAFFVNDTLYELKKDDFLGTTGIGVSEFLKELNMNDLYFRYIRCDSVLSLKVDAPIRSFFLRIVKLPVDISSTDIIKHPIVTERYTLPSNNLGVVNVKISFKDFLFSYRVFKNEELKVKKRGISIYNPNNSTWWYIPKLSDTILK